jgi:hypothetical protein
LSEWVAPTRRAVDAQPERRRINPPHNPRLYG